MTAPGAGVLPDGCPLLDVRDACKTYLGATGPIHALRGVDLAVPRGSFTAVLGASGSGKTTLLRVIAGVERPERGTIAIAGQVMNQGSVHVPPERREIGVVPQNGVLFPHLDVAANIGFGLASWPRGVFPGATRRRRDERVDELLDLVGMRGFGKRRPDELSGGQQQRVALARALAPAPKLVLLDEPFSALDAGLRVELREEVRALLRLTGSTALLVTHDQEEALSLADRIVMMRDGRVAQSGSPEDIYSTPADLEVASFVGQAVLLPGAIEQDGATIASCALGRIRVRAARGVTRRGACTLLVRPEQLAAGDEGVPARVTGIAYFGHDRLLRLRFGADGSGDPLTARFAGTGAPAAGAVTNVRINGDAVAYGGQELNAVSELALISSSPIRMSV